MILENDSSANGMIDWMLERTVNLPKFIVDIGCSEGRYTSNSYSLIKELGWNALLVDPMKKQLDQAREKHQNNPNVTCLETALCEDGGVVNLFIHRNDGNGEVTSNHGSSIFNNSGSNVAVPCKSTAYETFVSDNKLDSVGILSIDTEGYDYNILVGLLPYITPAVIVTEFWDNTEQQKHELLLSNGYVLMRQMHADTIWCLPDFIKEENENG